MSMIGISTVTFDIDGFLVLHPRGNNNKIYGLDRRVSRTATLDGSASLVDLGYADADRTFQFEIRDLTIDVIENIRRIVKNYSELVLCTDEGAFFVTPEKFDYKRGNVSLRLLATGAA